MMDDKMPENRICFSFNFFKEYSVKIPNFNNFYESKISSINSVSDFIDTLREMGKYSKERLFSKPTKDFFHLNKITDSKSIDLIEKVLIDGYGCTQSFVDNFERTYIEFSTKNGKRVIAALIYGRLFECLFLDPNHLICPEKSRFIKKKESFSIPSVFQKWDEDTAGLKEPMLKEYIEMAIEDYKTGRATNAEDILEEIEDIIKEES